MSPSSTELLAYWRERFPSTLYVPVALFLAIPALSEGAAAAGKSALIAYLLVLQFRLWDDLADRERDRDRVLVRARNLVPFYVLFAALAVALLILAFANAYLMALFSFAVWYRWIARKVHPIVRYHVVLLKYPLFTCLASSAGLAAMALVYATFVAYEPLHDRSVRFATVAFADVLSWFALVALSTSVFMAIPAGAVAAFALRRVHRGEDGTLAGRALFAVSFASLLLAEGALS